MLATYDISENTQSIADSLNQEYACQDEVEAGALAL